MDTCKQACWLPPLETIVKRLQLLIIHGYIAPQQESVRQGRRHPKVQMRQCGRMKRRKVVRWTVDLLGPYWHDIEAKVIATDPTCTRFMRLTGLVSRSSLFQDKKPVWNLSTCKVSYQLRQRKSVCHVVGSCDGRNGAARNYLQRAADAVDMSKSCCEIVVRHVEAI
jgi:hypothetical protein